MSYILDALRKSEQQRQATQPDSVTDRILVNPPQPRQKSQKWIIALIIGNLLVVAYFVWYFTQKSPVEQPKDKATGSLDKQLLPLTSEKRVLPLGGPSLQNGINSTANPLPPEQAASQPPSPSIAQLIEIKKKAEIERPVKKVPEKKLPAANKEPMSRSKASSPASQPEYISAEEEIAPSPTPELATKRKGVHDLNELPYEQRNTLPNLTINVFSYAQQPEDRFVIINMVKYRTGQLINGSVKLKEIRADSIVLETGNETFKVDRP